MKSSTGRRILIRLTIYSSPLMISNEMKKTLNRELSIDRMTKVLKRDDNICGTLRYLNVSNEDVSNYFQNVKQTFRNEN